jgi:hypothetical protein
MKKTVVHTFSRGQRLTLDTVYDMQRAATDGWWEKTGDDLPSWENDSDMSESLIVTRDVKITITIEDGEIK